MELHMFEEVGKRLTVVVLLGVVAGQGCYISDHKVGEAGDPDEDASAWTEDCDNADDQTNPEVDEIPYNGVDDDCDENTPDDDLDGDGYLLEEDCDDEDAGRHPGQADPHCDGSDQNCDGMDGVDADGDGWAVNALESCDEADCDDSNPARYPGAAEECGDSVVNDCGGSEQASWSECFWSTYSDLNDLPVQLHGEGDEDRVGNVLSSANVDGLGGEELIVGAKLYGEDADLNRGATYVISGAALRSGRVDTHLKIVGEEIQDYAGSDVAGLGDIDQDGLDELVVGAYGNDAAVSNGGAVYLLSGADLSLGLPGARLTIIGDREEQELGKVIATLGDDLLLGDSHAAGGAGSVLMFESNRTGIVDASDADSVIVGEGSGVLTLGYWVFDGADVLDDDGIDDLILGDDVNGGLIILKGPISDYVEVAYLPDSDTSFWYRESDDRGVEHCVESGDIDGDGSLDVVVGAPYFEQESGTVGAVYILGDPSGDHSLAEASAVLYGEQPGDRFGSSVAIVGTNLLDMNADGTPELLVGARTYERDGQSAARGAAYLITDVPSAGRQVVDSSVVLPGSGVGDNAGSAVIGGLDLNADAFADFAVAAEHSDVAVDNAGTIHIGFGGGW
ncbi:MAG: FG-GAP repeat protein [Alphaproteobacteria bacterium]|nr:FG-GAP repeat protein [Alphaproteobacteria bacterium]